MGAVAYAGAGGKELAPEEEIKVLKEELFLPGESVLKSLAIFSKETPCR